MSDLDPARPCARPGADCGAPAGADHRRRRAPRPRSCGGAGAWRDGPGGGASPRTAAVAGVRLVARGRARRQSRRRRSCPWWSIRPNRRWPWRPSRLRIPTMPPIDERRRKDRAKRPAEGPFRRGCGPVGTRAARLVFLACVSTLCPRPRPPGHAQWRCGMTTGIEE